LEGGDEGQRNENRVSKAEDDLEFSMVSAEAQEDIAASEQRV
jgi:hypothetical protein